MAKSIINIVNISKRFIDRVLLDDVNLLIEEKSKKSAISITPKQIKYVIV